MDRRTFVKNTISIAALSGFLPLTCSFLKKEPLFKISLAEWSLHNTLFGDAREKLGGEKFSESLRKNSETTLTGEITNLDFPVIARQKFGIEGVEYVNQFFLDKARDEKYLRELKNRANQEGVTNVLIMIDMEGSLGAPGTEERKTAIDNHIKWIDAAAFLGCNSIRVNAHGEGTPGEQQKQVSDSLYQLAEYGDKNNVNVIVENHGRLSSDPDWLSDVLKQVNHPRAGTLPDFGNFPEEIDKYLAIQKLMAFAKGVSAKSNKFDEHGNEISIDFKKMMEIVLNAGYRGFVGIEFSGPKEVEYEGIRKTKILLERIRNQLKQQFS
jgi:sugar phosphate isomerase/epimerase